MKNVLITGISGQDGIFLTKKYFSSAYDVCIYGVTRNPKNTLKKITNFLPEVNEKNIKLFNLDLENSYECEKIMSSVKFDYIYNLSGPSNVYESLKKPTETSHKILNIFDNLVKSTIKANNVCNFFQASSSEMFGKNGDLILNEESTFSPNSPYAKAKLRNHLKIKQLNVKYDINFTSGIMFNHESEFRAENFLFVKIIDKAIEIKKNKASILEVGSLNYKRDWSYAEDIVDAFFMINSNPKSDSYLLASGISYSIEQVVEFVFDELGLDYRKYIKENNELLRQGDPIAIHADVTKIKRDYGWSTSHDLNEILKIMINQRLKIL